MLLGSTHQVRTLPSRLNSSDIARECVVWEDLSGSVRNGKTHLSAVLQQIKFLAGPLHAPLGCSEGIVVRWFLIHLNMPVRIQSDITAFLSSLRLFSPPIASFLSTSIQSYRCPRLQHFALSHPQVYSRHFFQIFLRFHVASI
jgi:hypothetical protein